MEQYAKPQICMVSHKAMLRHKVRVEQQMLPYVELFFFGIIITGVAAKLDCEQERKSRLNETGV